MHRAKTYQERTLTLSFTLRSSIWAPSPFRRSQFFVLLSHYFLFDRPWLAEGFFSFYFYYKNPSPQRCIPRSFPWIFRGGECARPHKDESSLNSTPYELLQSTLGTNANRMDYCTIASKFAPQTFRVNPANPTNPAGPHRSGNKCADHISRFPRSDWHRPAVTARHTLVSFFGQHSNGPGQCNGVHTRLCTRASQLCAGIAR